MLAGVQGSGKTTACAKLAKHLKAKGRRPLLIAADLERPAAVEQLRTLGSEIGVPVWSEGRDPVKSREERREGGAAHGRRRRDHRHRGPAARRPRDDEAGPQDQGRHEARIRSLMACDAMTGQDAVVQARAFMHEVDTTGFILTKLDGDARGGAALSMTAVTGRPIFFAGTGEKLDDLEPFYPDRMAGRILGMGDVLTPDREGPGHAWTRGRGRGRRADDEGPVHARGLPHAAARDAQARAAPGPAEDAPGRAGRQDRG